MNELSIDVTRAEIEAAVAPFVTARVDEHSDAWRREVSAMTTRFRRQRLKRMLFGRFRRFRRTQHAVEMNYSRQWLARPLEAQVAREGAVVPCQWNNQAMYARGIGLKRVHQLYVMRVLEALRPRHVLEVGAGNGINLFVLAARFPEITFTGLELTEGGTLAATAIKTQRRLPEAIAEFSPEPPRDNEPFDRIRIVRGSAERLPFPDAAFDVVFTSLALEQMEEIRSQALVEIRRVARAHTIMVEPFYDWNASGIARDYIVANDYFAARVSDLPGYGLEPVFTTADMPAKLHLRPGVVVCRVRE
jgi:SAM-dependent methyltransferase